MATNKQHPPPLAQISPAQPRFRSAAVARMAGMPVATLRIWEQRYRAVSPVTSASGHRLYAAHDVERLMLLRQLTQSGHAIGLLAGLGTDRLREMLSVNAPANPGMGVPPPTSPTTLRIVVVGPSFARRLQQWGSRSPGRVLLQVVGVFESLAQAAQAAPDQAAPEIDVLLWQAPSLHCGASQPLQAAQHAWRASAAAVVYRYSNAAGRTELAGAGVALFHASADDQALGLWLASLPRPAPAPGPGKGLDTQAGQIAAALTRQTVSPPRFTELALTEFAGLSSTIACECPSHLAQLLMQISNFETYSAECAHRSPADAELHAYLQRTAGLARMLFEAALEHVAIAEGLQLPAGPATTNDAASAESHSPAPA